jgi:hypothetical protein
MVKGFLADPAKVGTMVAGTLLKSPDAEEVMSPEQAREWAFQLFSSFAWAWGDLLSADEMCEAVRSVEPMTAEQAWDEKPDVRARLEHLAKEAAPN